MDQSPGSRFRNALKAETPLQIVGTINAHSALLAQKMGFRSIYLSGGGVSAGSLDLPDLGISTLDDVLVDIRRITDVCNVPLLANADTGFGPSSLNISRITKAFMKFGAAAMHLEDQIGAKRCGHRPGKQLVTTSEMTDRLKAALDARTDEQFFVIARTDALSSEGLAQTIQRAVAYAEAGADAIFPEAVTNIGMYEQFASAVEVPILANLTEFGVTPLFPLEDLAAAKMRIVLYPLSAFRAMNKAAQNVYNVIRRDGTQRPLLDTMQTRAELYDVIGYQGFEEKVDTGSCGQNFPNQMILNGPGKQTS